MAHLNIKFPSPCSSIGQPSFKYIPQQNSMLISSIETTVISSNDTRIQSNKYNSSSCYYYYRHHHHYYYYISSYIISPTTLTFLARVIKRVLRSSASFTTKISSTPSEKPCLWRNAVNNFENAVNNMLEHVPPCN